MAGRTWHGIECVAGSGIVSEPGHAIESGMDVPIPQRITEILSG